MTVRQAAVAAGLAKSGAGRWPGGDRGARDEQRRTVAGGIADSVDGLVRERFSQYGQHLAGQLCRGGGAFAGPEPKQDRQTHRMRTERQPHDDPDDHPPIAAAEFGRALRRPVMGPKRVMDLLAPAAKQRAASHRDDRCAAGQQPAGDQPGGRGAGLAGLPDTVREEPARAVK